MLSFNRKFGLGAALRQRSIWAGSARNAPGLVINQLNPYKPRRQTSPANLAAEKLSYNGTVYIGKVGSNCYTSPDLVTYTARTPVGGNTFMGAVAVGTRLVALTAYSGNFYLCSSADNGATWGAVTATGTPGPELSVAGGIAYVLSPANNLTGYVTVSSAGVQTSRNFPLASQWGSVVASAAADKWVVINVAAAGTPAALYSGDGINWTVSSSYATEAAKLNAFPAAIYSIGSRFVVVAINGPSFSTMYSDDGGVTWLQGASYGRLADGRAFTAIHKDAVVLDGHLYISAAAGGTAFILSTPDGVAWRIHSDINATASLPGLYKRAGADSFVFNTGSEVAPVMETNVAAQEIYYEL